jgi:hypothetical protein
MNSKILGLAVVSLMAAPAAHAAMIATDGGLGVYDSTNNVTWVSNANLFASQYGAVSTIIADANSANGGAGLASGKVSSSDFVSTGVMTWAGANAWVYYLDAIDYGGSKLWALPTTVEAASSATVNPLPSSSQLAMLFYGSLGGTGGSGFLSTLNGSSALFSNFQSFAYWSGTQHPQPPGDPLVAWDFNTEIGAQNHGFGTNEYYALALSPGHVTVATVPEPGTAWLLGGGLVGLLYLRRRSAEAAGRRSLG